jgi:prefoldin subunit 5
MSKQLVMESYVDECLDEVEIRGLFIQEGIMDSPLGSILDNLYNKIDIINSRIIKLDGELTLLDNKKSNFKGQLDKLKGERRNEFVNKQKILDLIQKVKNDSPLGTVPYLYQIIGATMIVAAIAYTSYKLYKRFMSKAAKACQGKKGKVKTICMNQYQIKGLEVSKKPLTDGIRGCSKSKEVQSCKAKFNKKINAIDKRIKKKQNKIKKLMGR